jgi:SSS family solute:Na+ symporter
MPLYILPVALMIFAGCTAILVVPGLANGDLALLTAVRRTFPPWLLGVIGGAGALTAMVPAAIHIVTASTLVAKNIYKPLFAPELSDEQTGRVARIAVGIITVVALLLALNSSVMLVGLLLLAYSGIAQFTPGILLGVTSRWVTPPGILAGLVAGLALAGFLSFSHRDPFMGLNAGFVGLVLNIVLVVVVSRLTKIQANGFD